MHSILEFIRYPSHSRTLGILAFLAVLLAIPLTVNIAQKQQELRQHASGPIEVSGPICGGGGHCWVDPTNGNVVSWGSPPQNTGQQQSPQGQQQLPQNTGQQSPQGQQPPAGGSVSCPGNDVTTPHGGNTQVWGGSCSPSNGAKAYAIPGTCTCTVADCQLYPGTTSTYCMVNNGQSYPDPTGCNAKGANLPATCTANTAPSTPPSTAPSSAASACGAPYSGACTQLGQRDTTQTCSISCSSGSVTGHTVRVCQQVGSSLCWYDAYSDPGQASNKNQYCYDNSVNQSLQCPTGASPSTSSGNSTPCTKPSNPNANACVPSANTCGATSGTTTARLDILDNGSSACSPQMANFYPCTGSNLNNCPAPNNCNSSNQCVTPAGSPAPTATASPAPAGSTILTFSNIRLDGIGQNSGQLGSQNPPANGLRPVTVTVLDASGNQITVLTGNILYSNGSWTTATSIYAPSSTLPSGQYNFKIKTPNYINRLYSASITGGQANNLTNSVNLPTGDINASGGVDVNDINILVSCSIFSKDNGAACGANSAYKSLSDLNNDGKIDQYDYNLILREFAQSDQ